MTRAFISIAFVLIGLKVFFVSHDAKAEAGMIPFDSPVGEIGGRGHWYTLRTMKGKDYWKEPPVTSDIRENEDGSFSVLGEAPISIAIVLHPEWYRDDEPWRRAIDWVRQAEQMYRNSGVQIRFVIEHIEVWEDFPDTVSRALTYMDFDKYAAHNADLVVGLKPRMSGDPYCGVAYIGGRSSVSSCTPLVLAHEIGHNLGLGHAHDGMPYNGSKGYCISPESDSIDCTKGTIMSYAGSARVPLFAADGFTYKGNPLGTPEHTAVEHLRTSVVEKAMSFELSQRQPNSFSNSPYEAEQALCR